MVSSPAALALSDPVIVSFITSHARVADLPSLCLITKSFHSSATRRLYHSLVLANSSAALLACETLARTPALATHVRGLVLGPGPPRMWQALQPALEALPRLDALAIDARGMRLSWVLPLAPSFRLRDLRLCFPLEAQAAAFVRTQTALRTLLVAHTTAEVADPDPIPEPDTMDLPFLSTVECPLRLAHALVRSPLTHLQVLGDSGADARATGRDAHLLRLIPRLACAHKTLRSLSLYDVPEALTVDVVALAAQHCPQLRYLGVLPLPAGPRTAVHEALIRFEALLMLEFELGTWMPLPTGALQRILVTELHTFCPSLRTVSLWLSSRRFVWRHNTDTDVWEGQVDQRGLSGWKSV
ncbi:hypothetical protein EDB92DRAFT_1799560 [Lactarius akahatsu]|uniref:Uncharacterized protein n=1 Tax=Lactarius akahatsu TaxID=416441 RepID=A0AAD4LFZ7_9AGAM|nr:hypothetical protein EDB92DRAFT_1799560 [Lactarius akahatsu]